MIIHPAIWDILILNRILTECRVFAKPDPEFPGEAVIYPVEQNAVIMRVIHLLGAAGDAKKALGLPWREPCGTSRN
jgi:hypothetical protein